MYIEYVLAELIFNNKKILLIRRGNVSVYNSLIDKNIEMPNLKG